MPSALKKGLPPKISPKKSSPNQKKIENYISSLINSSPLPKILYQYTDLNALKGIITNNELWATHWRYLNDDNEFKGAFKILKTCIDKKKALKKTKRQTKSYLKVLQNLFDQNADISDYYDVGLCSFSEKGDLLSQWRGYGKKYRSVSIGFNPKKLDCERINNNSPLLFCKVIYKDRDKVKIFNKMLDYINSLSISKNDYLTLHISFCILLLCCKDDCWKEEKEWRLLMLPTKNYTLDFNVGEYNLIPFYKLNCFLNNSISAIKKIILPKSENYDKAEKALRLYNDKLKNKIRQSKISIVYPMK